MLVQELPNGDLSLSLESDERDELQSVGYDYWSLMSDLFDHYKSNGSYVHFDAGNGNPFVGLTSAPCIAESLDYHDDGSISVVGRLWYLDDYMTRNDLADLIAGKSVTYRLAA